MDHDFYIYLSSEDNIKILTNNTPERFTTLLEREFTLHGDWSCAVTEVNLQSLFKGQTPANICICCDICADTFVYGDQKQILRRVGIFPFQLIRKYDFRNPYYVQVIKRQFNNITVTVLDENLQPSGLEGEIDMVIRFHKL